MKTFKKLSLLLLVLGICVTVTALSSCGAIFDMFGIEFGDDYDEGDNYHEGDKFDDNYDPNNQGNNPSDSSQWEFFADADYDNPDEYTLYGVSYHGYGTPQSINIPETFQGHPVTKIRGEFFNQLQIYPDIDVIIPDTIETIEDYFLPDNYFEHGYIEYDNGVYYIDKWAVACRPDALGETLSLRSNTVGIASNAFQGSDYIREVNLPSSLKHINKYAFCNNYQLKKVTMSSGVRTIGYGAFSETAIEQVDLGGCRAEVDNSIFYNCQWLTQVTGAQNLPVIGSSMFDNCDKLLAIDISGATEICSYAFMNCRSLTDITFGDGLKTVGEHAFASCETLSNVNLPDSVEFIGNYAFSGCYAITEFRIPLGIKHIGADIIGSNDGMRYNQYMGASYIGNEVCPYIILMNSDDTASHISIYDGTLSIASNAFYYRESLKSVIIPDSVVSIGSSAFFGCSGLTKVVLGDGITEISSGTFGACSSLTEIVIPASLSKVDYSAFSGCNNLVTVKFKGSKDQWAFIEVDSENSCFQAAERIYDYVESYDFTINEAGDGYIFTGMGDIFTSEVVIPSEYNGLPVVAIAEEVFKDNSYIKKVVIPEGVTAVPYNAFSGCNSLVTVVLPSTITEISDYAFENCYSLANINVPEGVTRIGSRAFSYCYNLTTITLPSTLNQSGCIGTDAFDSCVKLHEIYNFTEFDVGHGGYGKVAHNAMAIHTDPTDASIYIRDDNDFIFVYDQSLNAYRLVAYAGLETSVTLPDSVDGSSYYIGNRAFVSRYDITSVTLGEGVMWVGERAFAACRNLTTFDFGASNPEYIGNAAFFNCFMLSSIELPDSVQRIYYEAFSGCSSLRKVDLGGALSAIDDKVFDYCESLETILIPDTLTSIGDMFTDCYNLQYNSYNNGMYLGNEENPYVMLVMTENNESDSIDIHPDTAIIGRLALENCYNLTYVSVPQSVKYIADGAFSNCSNLGTVDLPASLTHIGVNIFAGCSNLSSINYAGSYDDWSNVVKDNNYVIDQIGINFAQ